MELSKEKELEIKNLLEAGLKVQEIAEQMGLCKETIRRRSRKLGIKPFKGKTTVYKLSSLPDDLKQLVLGSLLGDGTFTKSSSSAYCMIISHAEKQLLYIKYKATILEKYNLTSGITQFIQFDKRYQHEYIGYRLRSRTNPLFKEVRDKFYNANGKNIVDTTIFEELSPLGLAIWYMDDGYVTKHSCIFSTVSIPIDTQEKLAEILLKKFDLHFTIGHNDNSMYLCASDFNKFKELISPFVTDDLKYKLVPYRHRVLDKSDELLESCDANQQPSLRSA
jgi:hypothetical protein